MLTAVKIDVPHVLLEKARACASERETTLTALVIENLESLTHTISDDPLVLFSRNLITKQQAIDATGLRDYAQLLVAMGDADLPLPTLPHDLIEEQAQVLARLLAS